jgi:hypothetical protein
MVHGNTVISHFGDNIDRKCTYVLQDNGKKSPDGNAGKGTNDQ